MNMISTCPNTENCGEMLNVDGYGSYAGIKHLNRDCCNGIEFMELRRSRFAFLLNCTLIWGMIFLNDVKSNDIGLISISIYFDALVIILYYNGCIDGSIYE